VTCAADGCDQPVPPKPAGRRGYQARYCSKRCRERENARRYREANQEKIAERAPRHNARQLRRYHAERRRTLEERAAMPPLTCAAEGCSETFLPLDLSQRYCSERCRSRESARRSRERNRKPPRQPSNCKTEGCANLIRPTAQGGTPRLFCSSACKARHDNRARRERDPERAREYDRERRAADPEKYRERDRRRYAADPKKRRESVRRARAANPDYNRNYAKANPHVYVQAAARRRTKYTPSDLTAADIKALKDAAHTCPICGVEMTGNSTGRHLKLATAKEFDHIVPLAVGGLHVRANVRVICRGCNLSRPKDGSDGRGHGFAV
jgi:hypothetical protein